MAIALVILNYRTPSLAVDCLASVQDDLASIGGRALVVDNASADGSCDHIAAAIAQRRWDAWCTLMPLDHNGGYAAGNNAAIRAALQWPDPPRYIMLLNPDTRVDPGAVRALVEFLDAHPRAGIAGSALRDELGREQIAAHRFPSPFTELLESASLGLLDRALPQYVTSLPTGAVPRPADWVSGSSLMVRREVFQSIGLLDEGYFLYFDEVDFCSRAKQAGWEIWSVPASRVVHLHGQSTNINNPGRRAPYWYASRRRFFIKRYGIAGLLAADVLWGIGRLSFVIRRALRLARGGRCDPARFARDLLWGDARSLLLE